MVDACELLFNSVCDGSLAIVVSHRCLAKTTFVFSTKPKVATFSFALETKVSLWLTRATWVSRKCPSVEVSYFVVPEVSKGPNLKKML